jgi:hypothetical protein
MNREGPDGSRVFRDLTRQEGSWFREKSVGRGLAVADYDNDGDLDFFLLNLDRTSQLIRNDGGNCNHWLQIELVGTRSNRDAIGARVTLRTGDRIRVEEKRSATGYLSQNDPRLHFGLGSLDRVDEIEVRWPSGAIERFRDVPAGQVLRLTEVAP